MAEGITDDKGDRLTNIFGGAHSGEPSASMYVDGTTTSLVDRGHSSHTIFLCKVGQ